MADFITNHYLIIMIVAAFLILALIGFMVDNMKNKKKDDSILESASLADEALETNEEESALVEAPEEIPVVEAINEEEEVNPQIEEGLEEPEEIVVVSETDVEDNK